MEWVKLATRYYLDPAVAALPDADAEVLFLRGLAYAGAEETEGWIPANVVPSLTRRRRYEAHVKALVAARLWVPATGGYRIPRWPDWQRELDDLARRRSADRERKRRERERRKSRDLSRDDLPDDATGNGRTPWGVPDPEASPDWQVSDLSRDESRDRHADALSVSRPEGADRRERRSASQPESRPNRRDDPPDDGDRWHAGGPPDPEVTRRGVAAARAALNRGRPDE